jgi:hypothetical protein
VEQQAQGARVIKCQIILIAVAEPTEDRMDNSFQQLLSLLKSYHGQRDVQVDSSHPDLRLKLDPETIDLWGATYDQANDTQANLLLATTSSSDPIEETSLTWVVGSAIRHVLVSDQEKLLQLLKSLGLGVSLAEAVIHHCPGIAGEAIWALYYERHGHLVASPVLSSGLGREVLASLSGNASD